MANVQLKLSRGGSCIFFSVLRCLCDVFAHGIDALIACVKLRWIAGEPVLTRYFFLFLLVLLVFLFCLFCKGFEIYLMKHLAIFCSITQTNTLYKEWVHLPDLKFDKSSKSIQVFMIVTYKNPYSRFISQLRNFVVCLICHTNHTLDDSYSPPMFLFTTFANSTD